MYIHLADYGRFLDDRGIFEADIEWLAAANITNGCNPPANNQSCPTAYVTRGQMGAFLVRAFGLSQLLEDPLIDDNYSIFETDINGLAAAGVTRGCNPDNKRFCPMHV